MDLSVTNHPLRQEREDQLHIQYILQSLMELQLRLENTPAVMKYSAQSYSELLQFERGAIHALNT